MAAWSGLKRWRSSALSNDRTSLVWICSKAIQMDLQMNLRSRACEWSLQSKDVFFRALDKTRCFLPF